MKEGWRYEKLGDIVTFRRGLTYSKNDEAAYSNKVVLRSNNVDLFTHQLTFDELKYLKDDFEIPFDKYLKKGELLMCMSNGSKVHLGKVALSEKNYNYAFGGFMAAIEHNSLVTDKFLYYILISPKFKDYIQKLSDGANINNIKIRDLESFQCYIPFSLSEQQRIVSFLDAQFAKIDAIKANAEKQLQEAKVLFQNALKDLLTPKEGWITSTIGEIADIKGGKRIPKGYKLENKPTDHVYIRVADFNDSGSINLDSLMYINDNIYTQIKRYIITSKDVYISIAGTIGKTGIIPQILDGANLTENACRLIIKGEDRKSVV